jgi:hypothetical protein
MTHNLQMVMGPQCHLKSLRKKPLINSHIKLQIQWLLVVNDEGSVIGRSAEHGLSTALFSATLLFLIQFQIDILQKVSFQFDFNLKY